MKEGSCNKVDSDLFSVRSERGFLSSLVPGRNSLAPAPGSVIRYESV